MTHKIEEQDNEFFSIVHNKELGCFDFVLKQASYEASSQLLGIISFVHQMGVNCPDDKLRIGARLAETSSIVANDTRIIV